MPQAKELYQYNQAAFKVYAAYTPQSGLVLTDPKSFYVHHHLKVPPDNTLYADVEVCDKETKLVKVYPLCQLWEEVTDTKESECIILQHNKCHLQQAAN